MPRIREKLKKEKQQYLARKWILTISIVGLLFSFLLGIATNRAVWLAGVAFFGCIIGGMVVMDLWGLWKR